MPRDPEGLPARAPCGRRRVLALALVCHVALALGYLLATPVLEGPDENGHFGYARHLARTGELPLVWRSAEALGRPAWHEATMGHHPPLYYALLAGTLGLLGASDLTHVAVPRGTGPKGVLRWRHGWDEHAPVSLEVAVFRLLRGASVVFGALTLLVAHGMGRAVFPSRPGVADAGVLLLACLPQWSFTHAVLDNGDLALFLCHAALFVLALALVRRRLPVAHGALLGGLVGLALATKLTALFLLPLTAGAGLYGLWRWRARRRETALAMLVALALALALAGWFFARNASLYGDPLATAAHRLAYAESVVPDALRTWHLSRRFPVALALSFVGAFDLGLGASVLALAALVALASLAGWVLRARRLVEEPAAVVMLALAVLAVLAGVVRYNATFDQPQGRYLFPAAGPLFLLLGAGLVGLRERALPWLAHPLARAALLAAPPLAAGAVLAGAWRALVLDPALAGPHHAALVAGTCTPVPAARATIEPLAPPDGAELRDAPTFRWEPAAGAGADARYTLYLCTADGRLLAAAAEWTGEALAGPAWDYPATHWKGLPTGEPIHWRVRRLPNRLLGEGVSDVEESPPRTFVRIP